jgi:hypothetical protein
MSTFSSFKDLLPQHIRAKGLSSKVEATLIIEEFDKIVPKVWDKEMSEYMKAVYFRNKVLAIAVLHPTVAQEIKFKKHLLLAEMDRKFGAGKIRDIIIIS